MPSGYLGQDENTRGYGVGLGAHSPGGPHAGHTGNFDSNTSPGMSGRPAPDLGPGVNYESMNFPGYYNFQEALDKGIHQDDLAEAQQAVVDAIREPYEKSMHNRFVRGVLGTLLAPVTLGATAPNATRNALGTLRDGFQLTGALKDEVARGNPAAQAALDEMAERTEASRAQHQADYGWDSPDNLGQGSGQPYMERLQERPNVAGALSGLDHNISPHLGQARDFLSEQRGKIGEGSMRDKAMQALPSKEERQQLQQQVDEFFAKALKRMTRGKAA